MKQPAADWGNRRQVVSRGPGLPVVIRDRGRDGRSGGRGRRGRESEDGAGHECADRTNREDGWCEDFSPNSHDYLHAFAEVNCLRPGIGGPTEKLIRLCDSPVFGSYIS